MGKMKELLIEMEETGLSKDELLSMNEEAHYVHTMNAFVELIVVYGYDKVIGDLRTVYGRENMVISLEALKGRSL